MTGQRRSLSQQGGRITSAGDPEAARLLADALAAADGGATDDLTHGFHAYPARMHPVLARELIGALSSPGEIVLDPFAGSGTVLVEALVAGCKPQGVDLSPLGKRIAEIACSLRDRPARKRFGSIVQAVAEASEARVRARAEVRVPISRAERAYYQPHVLLELSGLWSEIQQLAVGDRRPLEMVFSTLLVKFSRQRADTSEHEEPKRIRKGLPTEFFARKAHELALRWEALWDAAPEDAFPLKYLLGDARRLPELLGERFRADFVLCSPPYGGTYDYADQHARRAEWLDLDMRPLREAEVGARRNLSRQAGATARWDRELSDVLASIRAVVRREARVVLWLGDAELDGRRIESDRQLARIAPQTRFSLVASAAQERADVRGGAPRREHLIFLQPT